MARLGHPVFEFIVDRLSLPRGGSVVDLGCGEGPALHAVARRHPSVRLVGLDEKQASIDEAKAVLSGLDCDLRIADLNAALPFGDGVTDAVLCHNVLECLTDPLALVNDAGRMLRRGGQALLSHVDFDAIVIQGPEVSLNRRVIHSYADFPPGMRRADGVMGRKLAGLVNRSNLRLVGVDAHLTISSELVGDAVARVDEIAQSLRGGVGDLTPDEITRWRVEIRDAAFSGDFFYAETTFLALASRD